MGIKDTAGEASEETEDHVSARGGGDTYSIVTDSRIVARSSVESRASKSQT